MRAIRDARVVNLQNVEEAGSDQPMRASAEKFLARGISLGNNRIRVNKKKGEDEAGKLCSSAGHVALAFHAATRRSRGS
ncbi:hypothetical protein GCM10011515_10400 [Tsuneonella deserti]|uniref:Uncharacterized protein n=1 Tax=Tsuneonella deserti TaxID=2035528 RepID=A0ABQ1S7W4_9SPHN|nr:hypothetical protein GCM10011515_10400 [Tsuneonella deserti]